jgi:hypothetical protein
MGVYKYKDENINFILRINFLMNFNIDLKVEKLCILYIIFLFRNNYFLLRN